MSLIPPRLARTVAALVALSMAGAPPAANAAGATLAHDRGENENASSGEEGTPPAIPCQPIPPQDAEPQGAPFAPELEPLTRVRIVTRPPGDVHGTVVREDPRSVLLSEAPGGQRFALSKAGQRLEGQVGSVDGSSVTLLSKGLGIVRVRREDIVRLQIPGEGSFLLGLVGGFLGLFLGALSRARFDGHETDFPILDWLVPIGSAVAGAKLLGHERWKTVPLPGDDRVSLVLMPAPDGAAVGLRVSF